MCPSTGNVGPCVIKLDSQVCEDVAGGNTKNNTPLTAKAIAADLGGVDPPSWEPTANYWVYFNHSNPRNRLLVFAPGSPDPTDDYRSFAVWAAKHGYHVIVLLHWNAKEDSSPSRCNTSGLAYDKEDGCITGLLEGMFRDKDALTSVHSRTKTGSALVDEDQYRYRLRKTLQYLKKNFPGQGWGQFAAEGGYDKDPYIKWKLVTLAGHSSGSKLMSHIAHEVRVDRLILLSGPNVFAHLSNGDRACPTSIAPTHATGPARIYAYYNTNDGKAEDAERCHKAMNLAGRVPINSDYAASHAHVIFNPAPAHSKCPDGEENTGSSHVSTAKNCALEEPPDGGDLRPSRDQTHAVWDYLLRR